MHESGFSKSGWWEGAGDQAMRGKAGQSAVKSDKCMGRGEASWHLGQATSDRVASSQIYHLVKATCDDRDRLGSWPQSSTYDPHHLHLHPEYERRARVKAGLARFHLGCSGFRGMLLLPRK